MAKRRKAVSKKKTSAPSAEQAGARAKLLEAGRKLFAERGIDGVSVRDLAKASKTNISLVSYYFGGKEGLYTSVVEDHAVNTRAAMLETLKQFHGQKLTKEIFREQLRTIVAMFVTMRSVSPEIALIIQRDRLSGLPRCRRVYEEIMVPLADELVAILSEAQKAGIVRKDLNVRTFFVSMLESIMGYFIFNDCRLTISKDALKVPRDNEQFIDFLVRLYTEGIIA